MEKIKNKINILVTGGLGYIGSHTVVELLSQENINVVIIDNCSNSSEKVLDRIKEITNKTPLFYNVNLLDTLKLEEIFTMMNYDAVIHFAGKKSVAESQSDPLLYYKHNIIGSINLIDLCVKYEVKNFIFSSSACVYGNTTEKANEDEENLDPINTYGKTKLYVENILQNISKTNRNFKCVILRYCNPVAAHKTGLIGENPNGVPANLFPVIENHLRGKTEKISIFGNDYNTPDGTAIRDYVHVVDIAQGHVKTLQCFESHNSHLFKNNSIIYNMGTNSGYSVLEVVNTYQYENGVKIQFEFSLRRPGDAERSNPDSNKIIREIGWKPSTSLNQMCKDSYNYITKNPNGII